MSRNLQGRRGQTASKYLYATNRMSSAINHRTWKTELPVRSVVLKPCAGRLVVGWVTTSEYLLLIVLHFCGRKLFWGRPCRMFTPLPGFWPIYTLSVLALLASEVVLLRSPQCGLVSRLRVSWPFFIPSCE